MKARFSPAATILLLMMFLGLLSACGQSERQPSTVVNPATVSLSKQYKDNDAAKGRIMKVKITPSTMASASTSTQPTVIPFDDQNIIVPVGVSASFEVEDKGVPAFSEYTENADAVGPSLRTTADKGDFTGQAPDVQQGGSEFTGIHGGAKGSSSRGSGGSFSASWLQQLSVALSGVSAGVKLAWVIGLLLIVGAGLYALVERVFNGKIDWPLVSMAAGLGLTIIVLGTVAEKYPWMFAILFLVGIGAVVWYVLKWKKKEAPVITLADPLKITE